MPTQCFALNLDRPTQIQCSDRHDTEKTCQQQSIGRSNKVLGRSSRAEMAVRVRRYLPTASPPQRIDIRQRIF